MPRVRDTSLLSGWLFADLMLGLAVLFLVASSAGIVIKPVAPPTLNVSPTSLDGNGNTPQNCTGGLPATQCTVTVSESSQSVGDISWNVTDDILNTIKYSVSGNNASGGILSPGKSVSLIVSGLPCQNGSFTFNAKRISDKTPTTPVTVSWHCTPKTVKPERLNTDPIPITVTVSDVNAFLTGSSLDDNVRQQIMSQPSLQGKNVGFVIVYSGAPDTTYITNAKAVSAKMYSILGSLSQYGFHVFDRSAYYSNLYVLGVDQSQVSMDVFFFTE